MAGSYPPSQMYSSAAYPPVGAFPPPPEHGYVGAPAPPPAASYPPQPQQFGYAQQQQQGYSPQLQGYTYQQPPPQQQPTAQHAPPFQPQQPEEKPPQQQAQQPNKAAAFAKWVAGSWCGACVWGSGMAAGSAATHAAIGAVFGK